MAPPTVNYHCGCLSSSAIPPPPHLASSSYSFHPLHTLFFCEECDAVRCNRCVSVEVSGYYCPNCLFEVPSASVRAEKNRCARNCFMCPNCRNTLSIVPSDPPDPEDGRSIPSISAIGEPPFILYCNHCRWDSAQVGITFDKPTGLAAQLQRFEDTAPEALEFERLKEHFEPFLRASSAGAGSSLPSGSHQQHTVHVNSITAAASAALARDIPGVGRYNPGLTKSRSGRDKSKNKDEMPEYRSRVEVGSSSGMGTGGGEAGVEFMRHLETIEQVATLEQRWVNSWVGSLQTDDLHPLRIPLHSKRSKRCPACTHILIKPEQKAQSVRYKIKLMAANYLPAISIVLPHQKIPTPSRSLTKSTAGDNNTNNANDGMHAGKTYPFHLALTNPLYDPIDVRLSVQRMHGVASTEKSTARRPPFVISLPTSSFPIAAFAETWEYDDEEDMDMFGEDDEIGLGGAGASSHLGSSRDAVRGGKPRVKAVGVLEKRANVTVVGGEVVIGKEARGNIKFNMLVSYTYRSDDPAGGEASESDVASSAKPAHSMTKTFAFYTIVDLGAIIPKEDEVKTELPLSD